MLARLLWIWCAMWASTRRGWRAAMSPRDHQCHSGPDQDTGPRGCALPTYLSPTRSRRRLSCTLRPTRLAGQATTAAGHASRVGRRSTPAHRAQHHTQARSSRRSERDRRFYAGVPREGVRRARARRRSSRAIRKRSAVAYLMPTASPFRGSPRPHGPRAAHAPVLPNGTAPRRASRVPERSGCPARCAPGPCLPRPYRGVSAPVS